MGVYGALALFFALDLARLPGHFNRPPLTLISTFFIVTALSFAGLWLSAVDTHLMAGTRLDAVSRVVMAIDGVVLHGVRHDRRSPSPVKSTRSGGVTMSVQRSVLRPVVIAGLVILVFIGGGGSTAGRTGRERVRARQSQPVDARGVVRELERDLRRAGCRSRRRET